jgi:hypothetical protein
VLAAHLGQEENAQHSPYLRVDVKPYYERAGDSTAGQG